ncbi:MAG: [acyl-carrier-protein] S-malonyltransferase [Rhodospirillales bacterium]|jgi:[acyl-carrier-protein] S-malonyltransferase|nr:[acyl-carrier-protein] S-malonyltransferase [Rhodospirillales bacterium]
MALAFIFPGQGSQSPGMGRDLADAFPIARETFQEVDDALEQKLSRLIFEGPADELTLTTNAQPALMAVSMAVVRVLEREGGFRLADKVALVAGHSLGEYSALTAAGALPVAVTARLLRLRGQAMQEAVPPDLGAMAALLGAEADLAAEICAEAAQGEVVELANDNGGGQSVISGHRTAVLRAIEVSKARGVKRGMLLPVSAPFHSSLMGPAADVMAEALAAISMAPPAPPLVANVTAARVSDPAAIIDLLVRQVTGTVRWRECVAAMVAMGCDRFAEIGAGKVLTGLMKRNAPDATASAIGTPADIEAFLASV